MATDSPVPIAVFLSSFEAGGTERQMTELVRRLDRRRFAVHAVCFRREGPWHARVEEAVASVTAFPIQGFWRPATWRQARAFAGWCRARRIALLQTSDLYTNVFALPAAALAGVPVRIGSRRGMNPEKSRAKLVLQRLAYAAAHRVVANSQAAAARLAAERLPADRSLVIPNGIDLDRFAPPALRTGAIRRIVTVANLREVKGHDVLIDAAARLYAARPDLEYVLVGDGPCRGRLEARARALGIAHRVQFAGHRDGVPALLAAADLFVLPSRSESFPNGVMEAMAAGLPVVASAVGGVLELVEPGRTGALAAPGDPAALAAAIDALIGDPGRARAMGAAGRRSIEQRFSFDRMVARFEALYVGELAARGPRPVRAPAAA